jgi:hypothetical protein
MPLTEKGEKIKSAMEEKYGSEKGEKVFYASKNKGTISGVDAMPYEIPQEKLDQVIAAADALTKRFDAFMARRRLKQDADRAKMADARMAASQKKIDAFEEAAHPRNAGGVFTTGEGEEGKEDTQLDPGLLSKRNPL